MFLTLGIVFMFDSALLALGDLLFLTGLTMTIGACVRANCSHEMRHSLTVTVIAVTHFRI